MWTILRWSLLLWLTVCCQDALAGLPLGNDPPDADMLAAIVRLREWLRFLYGPVGDFVATVSFLIGIGAWTVFPKSLQVVVQKFWYVLLLGTIPLVVPILVAVAR